MLCFSFQRTKELKPDRVETDPILQKSQESATAQQ